jgi:predicted RNA-binding protein YlqC (UPF0109 family)
MNAHKEFLIEIVRNIVDKTRDVALYESGNSHKE